MWWHLALFSIFHLEIKKNKSLKKVAWSIWYGDNKDGSFGGRQSFPGGTLDHVCQLFVCQWMQGMVQGCLLTSVISSSLSEPVAGETQ